MTREDNITRTTIYLDSYLHTKAKEANINLSYEIANYLETILFGEVIGDAQQQLKEINQKIKKNDAENTILKARQKDLLKLIDEHDAKITAEHNIYTKFCNHTHNILNNMDKGYGVEYEQLKAHWKRDFFNNNGNICSKVIKIVLNKMENKKFTFDDFQSLRRGATLGN